MSDVSKNVDDVLAVLAERFGSTAEHLWEVMVDYHATVGLIGLAFGGLFILLALFGAGMILKGIRMENENVWGAGIVVVCLSLLMAILAISCSLPIALCPEYHALQDILGALS